MVLTDLVDDTDPGVRKVALTSVPSEALQQLSKIASQSGQATAAGSPEFEEAPTGPEVGAGKPGEGQNKMPGEKPAPGLMPGAKPPLPDGDVPGTGLMPGENP